MMQTFKSTFWQKYKWLIVVVVVLLVVGGGGGRYAYDYHNSAIEKLSKAIEKKDDSIQVLSIQLIESEQKTSGINQNIKTYYDEYIQQRQKTRHLQSQLKDIADRVYNRKYLDSLASSVTYPRSR